MTIDASPIPKKEQQIITQLRQLVAGVVAGANPLTLEQSLVALFGNVDRAIQTCVRYAAMEGSPMDLLTSNIRAYHQAMDAIQAMTDAIDRLDVQQIEAGFARLEKAAAMVVEEGVTPPPDRNTEQTLQRMMARMLQHSEQVAASAPEPILPLLVLAESLAQSNWTKALELGLKAVALGADKNPELMARVRRLLGSIAPGYHLPMMNDERRNVAWDKALRKAIRPGMKVLEIGTGAGMLAMMAARAGAGTVTTCEFNALVAEVARGIVAQNGFSDRIHVLTKSSLSMQLGTDLEERAELLFCDNFSDNMFSFEPLQSIADARARLLTPNAPCLPAGAAVRLALADWTNAHRLFGADQACGFDIRPAWVFRSDSVDTELGDPGMTLLSPHQEAFRFDFSAQQYPATERVEVRLEAAQDCVVRGIAQWIRLDLDAETFVEARPEPGAVFFSNPRFYPLNEPVELKKGQALRVHAEHGTSWLNVWTSGIA